jgi:RNA polymerase sigma-70 factor (ECF subfamily)
LPVEQGGVATLVFPREDAVAMAWPTNVADPDSPAAWPSWTTAIRSTLLGFMHFKSPTGDDRYKNVPSADRWILPEGLGPDELAAELTARFWDRLRFFATRMLRDAALAEDVAQETLRRVLEALRAGRVDKPEALPSFLFETARHVCMHKGRSSGREARAFQRVRADTEEDTAATGDPLSELISEERREQVRRCLARLDEPDRRLLAMSYDEELGAEEIGVRLGITAGAVRVRRHRALGRLAELIGVTKSRERELP